MNPKVNYLVVGLFVIAIGAATIIFALWLAFGYGQTHDKIYLIEMTESVAGLTQDAVVKFNGVSVGTIKDIHLNPDDPSEVIVKIAVEPNTPITVDTRATLMSQGLTGLSYINLMGGNEHSRPLLPPKGQDYAIIPTNPSLFLRIDASIDKLSGSLDKMSQAVNYLLRDENQKSISKILKNMADASEAFPETVRGANQTLQIMNTQTLPSVNESLLMLQSSLPNMSNFVQELSEDPSILLRGQKVTQLGPGESSHG